VRSARRNIGERSANPSSWPAAGRPNDHGVWKRAGEDRQNSLRFGSGCIAFPLVSYREFGSAFEDGQRVVRLFFGELLVEGPLRAGLRRRPEAYGEAAAYFEHLLDIDSLTYGVHRLLLPPHSLVKEYDRSQISSMPAIGTTNPADSKQPAFDAELGPAYERLMSQGFASYGLAIEGRVAQRSACSSPARASNLTSTTPSVRCLTLVKRCWITL
jgi:hypothetical protein